MAHIAQKKAGIFLGYTNFVLRMLIQLIYIPFMLKILGPSRYGIYQLTTSIVSYLSILDFGLSTAYLKFYSEVIQKKNEEKRLNSTYLSVFIFIALAAFAICILMSVYAKPLLGNKISLEEVTIAKTVFVILGANMAVSFINNVFYAIIISKEEFFFQKILELITIIANPILVLPLLFSGRGVVGIVCIQSIIAVFSLLTNMYYCIIKMHIPISIGFIDIGLLRRVSSFSFFLLINTIIDQINWNVDKYLIGRIVGSAAIAVYSVGAQINAIYIQMPDMIASVFAPKVNRIISQKENCFDEINSLFIKVGKMQSIIASMILFAYIIMGKEFIVLWVGKEYINAYYVGLLLIVPAYVPICQSLGVDIQRAYNMHQFRSIIYFIIAILNVGISIPLTGKYNEIGAAMGTTIAMIAGHWIIMNLFYSKKMHLKVWRLWKTILAIYPCYIPAILFLLITKYYIGISTWLKFIIIAIAYLLINALIVYRYALTSEEKRIIKSEF